MNTALPLTTKENPTVKYHTYVARILTKNGNPISGVTVSAVDENNARYKLSRQYPGSQIIEMRQRS